MEKSELDEKYERLISIASEGMKIIQELEDEFYMADEDRIPMPLTLNISNEEARLHVYNGINRLADIFSEDAVEAAFGIADTGKIAFFHNGVEVFKLYDKQTERLTV